jgi:hypothetical protein
LLRYELFLLGTGKGQQKAVVALFKYFQAAKGLICTLYQPDPLF